MDVFWMPNQKPVRIFRAYAEGVLLKIMGPTMEWTVTLKTPERALAARNFIRMNGVVCHPSAVRNLLANF